MARKEISVRNGGDVMDAYVSRAMQISCLSPEQIITLHSKERTLDRILANFEIQRIFALQPIRELHMIPDDGAAQEQHAGRIRNELLAKKVARDVHITDGDGLVITILKPWEAITEGNIERMHEYDFAVQKAVEEGAVQFAYEGGASTGMRLRDKLKTALR